MTSWHCVTHCLYRGLVSRQKWAWCEMCAYSFLESLGLHCLYDCESASSEIRKLTNSKLFWDWCNSMISECCVSRNWRDLQEEGHTLNAQFSIQMLALFYIWSFCAPSLCYKRRNQVLCRTPIFSASLTLASSHGCYEKVVKLYFFKIKTKYSAPVSNLPEGAVPSLVWHRVCVSWYRNSLVDDSPLHSPEFFDGTGEKNREVTILIIPVHC